MRKALACLIVSGMGIWFAVSIFNFAGRPPVRYSTKFTPLHRCIYGTTGPADAVIFGSSRVARGVYADHFTDHVVVRLHSSTRGLATNYQKLADFLTQHPPPAVVAIEVYDQRLKGEGDPLMGVLADTRTLWLDFKSPYRSWVERGFALLRALSNRINNALPFWVAGTAGREAKDLSVLKSNNCGKFQGGAATRRSRTLSEHRQEHVDLESSRGLIDHNYELSNMRRQMYWWNLMRELSPTSRFLLFSIPASLERPWSAELRQALSEATNMEVWAISEKDAQQLNYETSAFRDVRHLNQRGAVVFTALLAEQLFGAR